MTRNRSKAHRRTTPRVDAVCALCGLTRKVRPNLIAGCDVLLCASHGSLHAEVIAAPEGHYSVFLGHVAGYFHGYRYEKTGPSEARAVWRAQAIAAAAQGRPAPEPPGIEPEPSGAKLAAAIAAEVGEDGWEIADWVREGGVYEVKVYTEWGWAGFLSGTARQIAADLKALRDEAAGHAEQWRCPSCATALNPRTGPTQCGCGTVVWEPRSWSSPIDAAFDALTYVDGVPDRGTAEELMLLSVLLDDHDSEWCCPNDFATVVRALAATVPAAQWALAFDRPVGVIPTGATFDASGAEAVRDAAVAAGYRLVVRHSHDWGRQQLTAWFELVGDTDELPAEFSLVREECGSWRVLISDAAWWVPEDLSDEDDLLDDLELLHFELDGWSVFSDGYMTWRDGVVAERSLRFDPTDPDELTATLRDAQRALTAARGCFDEACRQLHGRFDEN